MAQWIRRETTNLKTTHRVVLWCNWLSLWTLNPAIRVQIPVEPFKFYLSIAQLVERGTVM